VVAAVVDDDRPSGNLDATSSRVVFLARKATSLAPVLQWGNAHPLAPGPERAWTDDYSDVLSALWLGLRR
jgi:hypothetical protein